MKKDCNRCSLPYEARTNSVYCPTCRKPAKVERETQRYREDSEYRTRRRKSVQKYDQNNQERQTEYRRQWAKDNSDKVRAYHRKYFHQKPAQERRSKRERQKLQQYGLTIEDYEQMLNTQGNVCAICGECNPSGRKLAVDHASQTHRVRGLLCSNCNMGIGLLKHSVDLLAAAQRYLV